MPDPSLEEFNRKEEQRKYAELSEGAKLYQSALIAGGGFGIADWDYEEFDPNETAEERAAKDSVAISTVGSASSKIAEGIYTEKGANKKKGEGVIFRDGHVFPLGKDFAPAMKFAQEVLGADTIVFNFGKDIGVSKKAIFGFLELNQTHKLALEQLHEVIKIAHEKNIAVELGPEARRLVRDMAQDTKLHGEVYKDFNGNPILGPDGTTPAHYEHYIDKLLSDLEKNRDYHNMKIGVKDAKLEEFNKEEVRPFVEENYLKEVNQKVGPDGKAIPDSVEEDVKLRAVAAEKAIKDLEARVDADDKIIDRLNGVKDSQVKMIENSQDEKRLNEIQEHASKIGTPARTARDGAISKLDTKNENNLKRVAALEKQLLAENEKILGSVPKNAENKPDVDKLSQADKDVLTKNKDSLEKLDKVKAKVNGQKTSLDDGIRAWETNGRDNAIKDQKERVAKKAEQTTSVKIRS